MINEKSKDDGIKVKHDKDGKPFISENGRRIDGEIVKDVLKEKAELCKSCGQEIWKDAFNVIRHKYSGSTYCELFNTNVNDIAEPKQENPKPIIDCPSCGKAKIKADISLGMTVRKNESEKGYDVKIVNEKIEPLEECPKCKIQEKLLSDEEIVKDVLNEKADIKDYINKLDNLASKIDTKKMCKELRKELDIEKKPELCKNCGFDKNRRGKIFLTDANIVGMAYIDNAKCEECGHVRDWIEWDNNPKTARIIYRNFNRNKEYFENLKKELIGKGYLIYQNPEPKREKTKILDEITRFECQKCGWSFIGKEKFEKHKCLPLKNTL